MIDKICRDVVYFAERPVNIRRKEDGDCYHPQSFNIMTYFPLQPRYNIYTDSLGAPLDDGYIYIGIANFDPVAYPTKVSWDESGLYPVEFPVRTMGGYPLRDGIPARMFINLADNYEYSILILDEDEVEVYSSSTGLGGYFAEDAGTLEGHPASYFAVDSEVVHQAGAETITGSKTISTSDTPLTLNRTVANGLLYLQRGGVNGGLLGTDATDIIFYNGSSSERMRLSSAGNLTFSGTLTVSGASGTINGNAIYTSATSSASDTFTTADAKTVTVVNGLITSIV